MKTRARWIAAVMAMTMIAAGSCTVMAESNSLSTDISGSLGQLFGTDDEADAGNNEAQGDLEGGSSEAPADDAYVPYRDATIAYLDENNIKYDVMDEESITIQYEGDYMDTIKVHVIFNAGDPNYVVLVSWSIGHFDEAHLQAGYEAMNEVNNTYKWVKFYLDDDDDVTAKSDLIVDLNSCGEEILDRVLRMVWVSDEAYGTIMAARWK